MFELVSRRFRGGKGSDYRSPPSPGTLAELVDERADLAAAVDDRRRDARPRDGEFEPASSVERRRHRSIPTTSAVASSTRPTRSSAGANEGDRRLELLVGGSVDRGEVIVGVADLVHPDGRDERLVAPAVELSL